MYDLVDLPICFQYIKKMCLKINSKLENGWSPFFVEKASNGLKLFKEAVELLINDPETEAVVMIGEIGGQLEADAANWYKASGSKKPVIGFIAGETAPAGRTMGHAGAIVGGSDDTAQAKKAIMRDCGIHVVDSPAEIGKKVAEVLG